MYDVCVGQLRVEGSTSHKTNGLPKRLGCAYTYTRKHAQTCTYVYTCVVVVEVELELVVVVVVVWWPPEV